ncbi:PepSY domain-containing protein [Sulfidibacter corallicola]|uniref:PepSY domain-containing protein n=1 Tax=Sulfidibacter corallicola TaxID=2818388 RepID=A0A8A4TH88_SULCO|nr:PepSY-associated TM helix domain-containing protein [Sulfidibacter corallicola]QTD48920.1 PepSY domain-containing protein [Sulfidibacter corallicola]
MQQRTRKIMYETHAWAGLILGIFLFVICFSGSVSLFVGELATWEHPELRRSWNPAPFSLESRLQDARAAGFNYPNLFVRMPNPARPYLHLMHFSDGEHYELRLDPHDGSVLPKTHAEIAEFLGHLHTDLHLPYPFGRYLIGFSGIFLLLLMVTGIVIHRKRWAELFLTRRPKTRRMWLTDLHKLLGTWSLPFITVIAFTGAILGLLGFLGGFMALASYDGDVAAATAAFTGPAAQKQDKPGRMLSLDALRDRALQEQPKLQIQYVEISEYGDQGAHVEFSGPVRGTLTFQNTFIYNLHSGAEVHRVDWLAGGLWSRLFGMVTPLHFASFGGTAMKWLYFFLGLGMTLLSATGTMIWLEKRLNQRRKAAAPASTERFARVALGICGGLPAATIALFWVHRLYPRADDHDLVGAPLVFWLVWLALTLVACFGPPPKALARPLLLGSGLAAAAVPVLNGLTTGHFFWDSWRMNWFYVFGVDATFLLLGLGACWYARRFHPAPAAKTEMADSITQPQES